MDQHVIIPNMEAAALQSLAYTAFKNKAVAVIIEFEVKTHEGLIELILHEEFQEDNRHIKATEIVELPSYDDDKECYGLAYMFCVPDKGYSIEKLKVVIEDVFSVESLKRSKAVALWY